MAARAGDPMAGGKGRQLRAADADRDQAAAILGTAYTEGRLAKDEYDARLEDAFSARTYAELDKVVADLPEPPVLASPGAGPAKAALVLGWGAVIFGIIVAVIAIVAGMHGAMHGMGTMNMP